MGVVADLAGGNQSDTNIQLEDWYRKTSGGTLDRKKYTYILGKKNDEIRGAVIYTDYTQYSITIDICAPNALTRTLIRSMFDYPFNQLKVQKVFGFIDQRNEMSIDIFTRIGGKEVARIPDFFGEGIARIVLAATKEDVKKWVT